MKDNDFWAQFWPKQLNNQYFILFNCLYWPKFSLSASCGRGFAGTLWKAKTTIESNRGSKIISEREILWFVSKKASSTVGQRLRRNWWEKWSSSGSSGSSSGKVGSANHFTELAFQLHRWSTNIFTRLCHAKQRLKLVSLFSPFYGTVSAPAGALYVMVAIMHHQSLLHDQCNNCAAPIALKQLLFNNCTATVSIQQLQQLNYTATISLHQFCCNNGTAYINATANAP